MSAAFTRELVERASRAILEHREELTALDRAVGDGDHGLNMARGFEAIAASAEELAALPFGKALDKAGMTLVTKVGGASGALFGSLLMAMGRTVRDCPAGRPEVADMLRAGVDAVRRRGKSAPGEKTMLDVLAPVLAVLEEEGAGADMRGRVRAAAAGGLAATRDMIPTKGRASFLGERAAGHPDPGARSSELLVEAVCDVVDGRRDESARAGVARGR
ncbi:MAG: dihydroxyacetone kinase subunit DhaL [Immundisolibacterales bacterium]|nr:dihydroxyacetone kinase subunit DhaL [Immundisolibacterales bacterium]